MTTALLLPGWGTSATRMRTLEEGVERQGIRTRTWTYEPMGSIRSLGAPLATEAARLSRQQPVHLIGHSLGGLVAASAVLFHGARVDSVTTINAPWRGTWAAWTAHPEDRLGRELRWRADALQELRDALELHLRADEGPRWTVMSAAGDLAATPASALRVPDGDRLTKRLVPVWGHSVSLEHPRLVDTVGTTLATAPV